MAETLIIQSSIDLIEGEPDDERSEEAWLLLLLALLQDRQQGRSSWTAYAPPAYRGLYDAQGFFGRPVQASGVWFASDIQRYGTGPRLITETGQRVAVQRYVGTLRRRIRLLTNDLLTGRIPLAVYQVQMRQYLLGMQLALAAVARGGVTQLGEADDRRVAAALAFQFYRLQVFARAMADRAIVTVRRVRARADNYVSDASQQYEASRLYSHVRAGFIEAKNVMRQQAEHCGHGTPDVPDCPTLTFEGWKPIRKMVPPGKRQCSYQCRCYLEFR